MRARVREFFVCAPVDAVRSRQAVFVCLSVCLSVSLPSCPCARVRCAHVCLRVGLWPCCLIRTFALPALRSRATRGKVLLRHPTKLCGRFYELGKGGLAKDEREAARLYAQAAAQGLAQNQQAQRSPPARVGSTSALPQPLPAAPFDQWRLNQSGTPNNYTPNQLYPQPATPPTSGALN